MPLEYDLVMEICLKFSASTTKGADSMESWQLKASLNIQRKSEA
jgi:hypothetical protein